MAQTGVTMTVEEIPKGWSRKKLKELLSVKNGKTDTVDAVEDGQYPLFDRSVLVKKSDKYLFDCEAIIIPGEGKDFSPKYYKGKFDLHQRAYAAYPRTTDVNAKFMYYAITNVRNVLFLHAVGSTVKSLRLGIIEDLEIDIPLLKEQEKIAGILTTVDEDIQETDNIIDNCERVKKALTQTLLTNGLPSRHKKFKKTEIGNIPEDWEVVNLGEVLELSKNKAYPPYKNKIYVGLENINSNSNTCSSVNNAEGIKSITNVFNKNEILYGKLRPNLNKAIIAEFEGICSGEILVLRPNRKSQSYFLYLHMHSENFKEYNSSLAFGTKMPRTSFNLLSKYKIPLPPIEEQHRISQIFIQFDNRINYEKSKKLKLEILKNSLMQKLLSGEIRVKV